MEEYEWWGHPQNNITGRWVGGKFGNIYIGSNPMDGMTKEFATQFDAFINVADRPLESLIQHYNSPSLHATYYWHPIAEAAPPWPYAAFFYCKRVLDYHFDRGHKIYIHCMAGLHRSPTMVLFWLLTKGIPLEEGATLVEARAEDAKKLLDTIQKNFERGTFPKNLMEFMQRMVNWEDGNLETYLLKPNSLL